MRARLVFSQSCSRLACVVSRRLATIRLMLSLSSATSPRASTAMDWVRSPSATALATPAIARTWVVRLLARPFTLSVSRFQVPETPSTSACPPRRPSVPTSRATRVTSSAKADSWPTIVLNVCLSCRISPRASTSIFLLRSPCATAVVTWAMFRTWAVRLFAIEFTFSVRSFQMPETPRTWAWPPRRPSVPTSRATRVTSSAKADSWPTIVLNVCLSWSTSPCASTVIFWLRSPSATAVATCEMFRTCMVRLVAMPFTETVRSSHTPETPRTWAWPPRRPSVPTSRATRVTSSAKADSWSTIVLNVCLSWSISPWASTVTLRVRSPRATAVVTMAMSRTCSAFWATSVLSEENCAATSSIRDPMSASMGLSPPSLNRRGRVRKSPLASAASASRTGSRSVSVYLASAGEPGAV